MKLSKSGLATIATSVTLALAFAGVSPASADTSSETEIVADLIAEVAPFQGAVQPVSDVQAGFSSGPATLPDRADSPIVLEGGDTPLEVGLPVEASTNPGVIAADGTVVYTSATNDIDIAAQVLDSGTVRIQTVINNPSASHEFTYEIGGGYTPVRAADGTIRGR